MSEHERESEPSPDEPGRSFSNPLNELEAENTMRNMAHLARVFYMALLDEGFERQQAEGLTLAWVARPSSFT